MLIVDHLLVGLLAGEILDRPRRAQLNSRDQPEKVHYNYDEKTGGKIAIGLQTNSNRQSIHFLS